MKTLRQLTCDLALSARGIPYIWAGSTPAEGFDCSGFIVWLLQTTGTLPPGDWTAEHLAHRFNLINRQDPEAHQPGDLAFYGETLDTITHVMLCLETPRVIGAHGGGRKTITRKIAEALGARVSSTYRNYRRDFLRFGHITYPDEA